MSWYPLGRWGGRKWWFHWFSAGLGRCRASFPVSSFRPSAITYQRTRRKVVERSEPLGVSIITCSRGAYYKIVAESGEFFSTQNFSQPRDYLVDIAFNRRAIPTFIHKRGRSANLRQIYFEPPQVSLNLVS